MCLSTQAIFVLSITQDGRFILRQALHQGIFLTGGHRKQTYVRDNHGSKLLLDRFSWFRGNFPPMVCILQALQAAPVVTTAEHVNAGSEDCVCVLHEAISALLHQREEWGSYNGITMGDFRSCGYELYVGVRTARTTKS